MTIQGVTLPGVQSANPFDIFTNNAQSGAANAQIAGINQGIGQALPFYNQGLQALQQNYASAAAPFQTLFQTGGQGTTAYGNALGLNGPQGTSQALGAFNASPAFQSALYTGTNAANAQAQATGQTGGAEQLALQRMGTNLANSGWQNYISSLAPYLNMQTAGATGLGSVYTGLGQQLNTGNQNIGNMYYGGMTSAGNAIANADLANLTSSQNIFGLASGLLGAGLKMSDEKVKEDIEPVGKLADGQNVYRYRYIGSPVTHIGLIAQETDPEAVFEVLPDLRAVDYHRATNRAAQLMRFSNDNVSSPSVRAYGEDLQRWAA